MAVATFGDFRVNTDDEFFIDSIIGNNLDGEPAVSTTAGEVIEVFPSGARAIFGGSFSSPLALGDHITSLIVNNPGDSLVFSVTGLSGVTIGTVLNEDAFGDALDQTNEIFTQGFDDVLVGDTGTEIIHAGGGNDMLTGKGGHDVLDGEAGNDTLDGGAGPDSLDGGTGDDQMSGGPGNDTYVVDSANDSVIENPGGGIDRINTSLAAFSLSFDAANVEKLAYTGTGDFTATGNELANTIDGGSGDDTLSGLAGADTLNGGAGNDTLDGGPGADKMNGGDGNDTYVVDNAADVITDSSGSDIVQSSVSYTLGAGLEKLELTGGANLNGTGNAADNTLDGNGGNNTLIGGAGSDTLNGGDGNDTLRGGVGDDTLNPGPGNDTVLGGLRDDDTLILDGVRNDYLIARPNPTQVSILNLATGDTDLISGIEHVQFDDTTQDVTIDGLLKNTASAFADNFAGDATKDTFNGQGGDDIISGGGDDDTLGGDAGNDSLDGGTGNDQMSGGTGNDTYAVDSAGDSVIENPASGIDKINTTLAAFDLSLKGANVEKLAYTGPGDFTGTGNELANTIEGGSGNDTLAGVGGADTLNGGAGNDSLDGGAGADKMNGGDGDDTYVVDNPADKITDSSGTDTVQSSLGYTLGAGLEKLELTGSANVNGIGNAADNTLTGNDGNNRLSGRAGDDVIGGGDGNDTLVGGAGNDSTSGGVGADRFYFNAPLDATNVDTVQDFEPGTDLLVLNPDVFLALGAPGRLPESQFHGGAGVTAAEDANDHVLYDTGTGALYYDRDGTGAAAPVQFATLTDHPDITADSFLVARL